MRFVTFRPFKPAGWTGTSWLVLVTVAAIALLVAINEFSFRKSQAALEQDVKFTELRSSLYMLQMAVLQAESGQRGYLMTGKEEYLAPYLGVSGEVEKHLETLRGNLTNDPKINELFGRLNPTVFRKMAELETVLQLKKSGGAWKDVVETDMGRQQMLQIREISDQLVKLASDGITAGQRELNRSSILGRWGVIGSSIAALGCLILLIREKEHILKIEQDGAAQLARERDQLEHAVLERTARLSELATHLQDAREYERQHLARELHDEMGALLTTAKLDVARIRAKNKTMPEDMQVRFDHLVETLNNGIALKRRIIEDLRPSSLTNLGLKAALENHVNDLSARSALDIKLDFNVPEMSDHANLTVFRIVQESLTNIFKHAEAKVVRIGVHEKGSQVLISVTDDGVGFDPNVNKPTVHGLAGMAHRVEVQGGRFSINSAPGKGTELQATFPLELK